MPAENRLQGPKVRKFFPPFADDWNLALSISAQEMNWNITVIERSSVLVLVEQKHVPESICKGDQYVVKKVKMAVADHL